MRYSALSVSLLVSLTLFSQKRAVDFYTIDRNVLFVKPASPAILSQKLTENYSTDLEKVRSIFRWIAEHIDYRMREPVRRRKNEPARHVAHDDTAALKNLDERVAETVLATGVAVCDGYARLFKTLCDYAGIRAEIITGYARTGSARRFGSNHTWNAVFLDGHWRLLDVTWSSGFITWHGNEFVRRFDEKYFLADPIDFAKEHYPEDPRWALLEETPTMYEFRHSPFRQKSFIKYQIASYFPSRGVIEASQGDTVRIELETMSHEKDRTISADPFLDTLAYMTQESELLKPWVEKNRISYTYEVKSSAVKWLYLLYNEDVILRYRLVVR